MALNRSQVRLVGLIVNPKRSWHPSARAMAAVGYWHELDGLIKLHEALCKAYGIGGY